MFQLISKRRVIIAGKSSVRVRIREPLCVTTYTGSSNSRLSLGRIQRPTLWRECGANSIRNINEVSSKVHYSSTSSSLSSYGLYRLLSKDERKLLEEQRHLTKTSRELASQVEATASKSSLLSLQQNSSRNFLEELRLDATFSAVIAGEFNAGKSTLINALLGTKLLETGALPTTDSITVVVGSTSGDLAASDDDNKLDERENGSSSAMNMDTQSPLPSLLGVVVHSVQNLPLLEDLTVIDTPGTNSAWMDHTERTKKMLPAADLILFVTSADRPFSDSERSLLKSIQVYRKNIVVVINKMDILETSGGSYGQEQKDAIVDFVTDKASELLGARPVVIPLSSRDALSAKLMEKKQKTSESIPEDERSMVWQRSNFSAFESFLKDTLTTQAKLRSKLSNPIGVSEGVMAECIRVLKDQREELQVDVATLYIFQSQFGGWKKELGADMLRSQTVMTEMVRQEGQRCEILLNRMSLFNFYQWNLFDTDQLEEEWRVTKREVSIHRQHDEDLRADLLEHVLETADSVATRGRAQGQAVIEYLGKRPAIKNNQSLVGSVTTVSRFEDTRKNLVEKLSNAVDEILKGGGEDIDKIRLFASFRHIAFLSSSLQAGALASCVLLTLEAIDPVTGWIAVSSLSVGGGAAYAIGKANIRQRYNEQWFRRAQHLNKALDAITTKEVDRINQKILDGVAPYTRFVETERERIDDLQERCERLTSASRNLRNRIQKL
mmetsp:Transcript_27004/g.59376  ORF Transcript_27004/g.59376 Transcript_27004/m.59376 type:complete len:724 (+) Transcript_27004:188-2359(+)